MALDAVLAARRNNYLHTIGDRLFSDEEDKFYTALHFCNLIKVSEDERVRNYAGRKLLLLTESFENEKRNDIVVELLRSLELDSYQFSKFIPQYLGPMMVQLNDCEYDEVVADFRDKLKTSRPYLRALLLRTIGVMIVEIFKNKPNRKPAVQAIRDGAYDYITKPFKLEEIKIVVNNAQERIHLVRENQRLLAELQEAYNQLHMVKQLMGANDPGERKESGSKKHIKDTGPFIAGSMLSHYYQENRPGIGTPLLSDLERISALRDRGFLTEEEFRLCKSKLFKKLQY